MFLRPHPHHLLPIVALRLSLRHPFEGIVIAGLVGEARFFQDVAISRQGVFQVFESILFSKEGVVGGDEVARGRAWRLTHFEPNELI